MPTLIDSELTCWGLLDVHSPEGGPSTPLSSWGVLPALKVPATQAVETVGPHRCVGALQAGHAM